MCYSIFRYVRQHRCLFTNMPSGSVNPAPVRGNSAGSAKWKGIETTALLKWERDAKGRDEGP